MILNIIEVSNKWLSRDCLWFSLVWCLTRILLLAWIIIRKKQTLNFILIFFHFNSCCVIWDFFFMFLQYPNILNLIRWCLMFVKHHVIGLPCRRMSSEILQQSTMFIKGSPEVSLISYWTDQWILLWCKDTKAWTSPTTFFYHVT